MRPLLYSFFALSILGFSDVNAAEPVVLVEHQGKYQGYFKPPRLDLVVTQINSTPGLYWPAAKLFKVDAESKLKLEQQRQDVLSQLALLKQEFQQEQEFGLVASVEKLEKDITGWVLAYRMSLPLDPDMVRAKKALNPILAKGNYKLVVGKRPEHIQIEGLVSEQENPLINTASVNTYVVTLSVMDGGSTSFVYVLPALDKYFLAKTGLWNRRHQEISPGTVLFVPFEQRHLPQAFNNINEQIVELLLHKVVVQ